MPQIEQFFDHFAPVFNPDNVQLSPIGRALPAQPALHNRPIGQVVYELTGRRREHLLADLPRQMWLTATEFDAYDLHVITAASERGADRICGADRAHLPEGPLAGGIEVVGPGRLAAQLGIAQRGQLAPPKSPPQ
jgi:hypothetical protein